MAAIVSGEELKQEQEKRRKLRWWHLLLPPAALIFFPVVAGAAIVAGIAIFQSLNHGAAPMRLLSGDLQKDSTLLQILMAISYLVMLAVMWWVARSRGAVPLTGYFVPIGAGTAFLAAGSSLLLYGALFAATNALEWSGLVTFHETKIGDMLQAHTLGQLCLTVAMASLLAPLVEEIYFRGLFLAWLRQNLGLTLSAAINAALFALVHGYMIIEPGAQGWIATAGIGCMALLNVTWTVRTGSLWPAIIVHSVFNGVQIFLLSSPVLWGHG